MVLHDLRFSIPAHLHVMVCSTHHYNSHYEDWYSNQPEEPHNDVHTTSSIISVCAWIIIKELGTIEVTTGKGVGGER